MPINKNVEKPSGSNQYSDTTISDDTIEELLKSTNFNDDTFKAKLKNLVEQLKFEERYGPTKKEKIHHIEKANSEETIKKNLTEL